MSTHRISDPRSGPAQLPPHTSSSAATPTGSVHKSQTVSVVGMSGQLKRCNESFIQPFFLHEVICTDINTHDTAWDQTANHNARDKYFVDAHMDANSTFLNHPVQPTRQDPATDVFSSPDATIIHDAFRDRYDWEPLDTLSADHRLT